MLYEYLISPQNFTHVLMLDADAALVKHSLDILGALALEKLATFGLQKNQKPEKRERERERIH